MMPQNKPRKTPRLSLESFTIFVIDMDSVVFTNILEVFYFVVVEIGLIKAATNTRENLSLIDRDVDTLITHAVDEGNINAVAFEQHTNRASDSVTASGKHEHGMSVFFHLTRKREKRKRSAFHKQLFSITKLHPAVWVRELVTLYRLARHEIEPRRRR